MPTHRGVVIRADHSGLGSAAGLKRLPKVTYRAVLRDKLFKGSLESVMQQIDDALGSTPSVPIPVRLPPPPVKKKAARKEAAKKKAAPKRTTKRATKRAKKMARRK